jgi:predicted DNA-binding transcriptional regulator AlpA
MPPAVLTRAAAAEYLGFSVSTLEARVRAGCVPAPRLLSPGRVGWIRAELDEWLQSRPTSSLPPPTGRSPRGAALPSTGRARAESLRGVRSMT